MGGEIQRRRRRERDEGTAGAAEAGAGAGGTELLAGREGSASAILRRERCLMTPASVLHCCRSCAASVFSQQSIQSWQWRMTLLQNVCVICSRQTAPADRKPQERTG